MELCLDITKILKETGVVTEVKVSYGISVTSVLPNEKYREKCSKVYEAELEIMRKYPGKNFDFHTRPENV